MGNPDIKLFLDLFTDGFNPGIIKLENLPGVIINKMIVLFEQSGFFKLGIVGTELMFGHQSAIQKQFYGIVQRCPADPVFMVLHPDIKGFNIKMPFRGENFPENRVPLGSFSMTVFLQVVREPFPDIFEGIFGGFFDHDLNFGSKVQL